MTDPSISLEAIEWRIGASDVRPRRIGEDVVIGESAEMEPIELAGTTSPFADTDVAEAGDTRAASGTEGPVHVEPGPILGLHRESHQAGDVKGTVHRFAAGGPHAHRVDGKGTRRVLLWRDVSALLFGAIAVVLIAQLALRGGTTSSAGATPQDILGATDVAAGPPGTGGSSAPGIGEVIDPSLIPIINATPTPIPTPGPALAPGATPRATPRVTPRPTAIISPIATPVPTPIPTVPTPTATPIPTLSPAPTAASTPGPTASPTPAPTAAPLPVAGLSCSVPSGSFTVTCQNNSTGAVSYLWDFGDGTTDTSATPPAHTYAGAQQYLISVTAYNSDGLSDTATQTVTVPGP